MMKTACAGVTLLALTLSLEVPALAAGCATPAEVSALTAAVIQQQLMVAAFQCHETDAYNRFVTSYRGELQASDATLKAYFVRRGGEAGYDSFKTKAANLWALEQARNAGAFCADAHALFRAALASHASLTSLVASRSTDDVCVEPRSVLQAGTKLANAGRVELAEAAPVPVHTRGPERNDAAASYSFQGEAPPRPRYYPPRTYYSYAPPSGWQQDWRDAPPPPPPPRYWYRDPYGR